MGLRFAQDGASNFLFRRIFFRFVPALMVGFRSRTPRPCFTSHTAVCGHRRRFTRGAHGKASGSVRDGTRKTPPPGPGPRPGTAGALLARRLGKNRLGIWHFVHYACSRKRAKTCQAGVDEGLFGSRRSRIRLRTFSRIREVNLEIITRILMHRQWKGGKPRP